MGDKSNIEWCDATWNPIVGCSLVSPGCTHCYAMGMAARLERMLPPERRGAATLPNHYSALTKPSKAGPVWTGRVNIAPEHILTAPLRWKRPRRIFVNSMGDLFHESIPDGWIDRVFAVMALSHHTFQVLTKRAERMRDYVGKRAGDWQLVLPDAHAPGTLPITKDDVYRHLGRRPKFSFDPPTPSWPLPNIWLGVSAEDQARADERIPHLLATPAAVRFISAEPLLGPIDLTNQCNGHYFFNSLAGTRWHDDPDHAHPAEKFSPGLDWVIIGGESGKNARPMHPAWARSLRDQCAAAGVPCFFKQWGEWQPYSHDGPGIADVVAVNGALSRGDKLEGGPEKRPRWCAVRRVGKTRAGRLLDGVEHNAFPEARA